MAITDETAPWHARRSLGTLNYKNLYNHSFGYTETRKKVAAGTTTAVLAATSGTSAAQSVIAGITQPDVPRVLNLTPTANTTNSPLSVVITGTNVEGKVITETFVIPVNSTTVVNGSKAFKSVTSIAIPGNTAGLTITVGTRNALGIKHRLFRNNTTVKVYSATAVYSSTLTLDGVPTVASDDKDVELNTVAPLTAPDGTAFLVICYVYDNWNDGSSVNDQPDNRTTTSTSSTSSSTSTTTLTTSTSTSSTSTSSTSVSTSSTSTSTSSTSTSTTTAP